MPWLTELKKKKKEVEVSTAQVSDVSNKTFVVS